MEWIGGTLLPLTKPSVLYFTAAWCEEFIALTWKILGMC